MDNNMLDLKLNLIGFKKITEDIISNLEKDNYDDLLNLFDKRQDIINLIDQCGCDKEEFKKICYEFKIQEADIKLQNLMTQKHDFLKEELKKINSSRKVNKNYNPNGYIDSIYFNKKI